MKTYELNVEDIDLVLNALRFTTEYGFNYEYENKEDLTEYNDMVALIERLDPKPVKKSGWVSDEDIMHAAPIGDGYRFVTWEE